MTLFIRRGEETEYLLRDPKAFALLSLIASRARYNDSKRLDGLKKGESLIGDCEAVGLTRGQYRAALKRLLAHGYITTRVVRSVRNGGLGTIATLANDSIFLINPDINNLEEEIQE